MCTYITEKVATAGSGKGASGWFDLSESSVYYDHPVHAREDHTLNIDFINPAMGPSARVAVELSRTTARDLAIAILKILDTVGEIG